MNIDFSVARKTLEKLISEYSPLGELSNEAQTRFAFIDQLLTTCLGWERTQIAVEVSENGERTDYECGKPRQLIVEAKRSDARLRFPPRGKRGSKIRMTSLMEFDATVKKHLQQIQSYCNNRGVQFAALSNGPQLVLFLANRLDGVSPLDGEALVYESYEDLLTGFSVLFECLSPNGVADKRLLGHLGSAQVQGLPQKLSSNCLNYFDYKYSNTFQEHLRNAAALVIEDINLTSRDLEIEFLRSCYCESGPLSQYSMLGKNMLSARYAALFSANESGSRVESVNPRKQANAFSDQILAEAMARRPVILLGDVGVGKSSFIKYLMGIRAADVFGKAVCIYFDLGSKGALAKTPRDALLDEVERTLRSDHQINLQSPTLLNKVYADELADFDGGYVSQLKTTQPAVFDLKRVEFISELVKKRDEHLRRCLEQIANDRRCQIVIVLDNADQRSLEIQLEAFIIAQELAARWRSMVFLALRPQTFHASKRGGAISAYPPKVFVIPPPKLEDAIEKRLDFAIKVAEGRLPVAKIDGLTMHVDSLAILIRALLASLKHNSQLYEFIVNVSGGNVRVAVELVSKYFGNPNVESDKIVKIVKETGHYHVPLHEFAKAGLLGDYAHFQEESSLASNIYAVVYPDKREHFLSLYLLGYLGWDGASRDDTDGFVGANALISELQSNGFTREQIEAHLLKLTRKKLIETPERRLLETDNELKDIGMPTSYRTTSLGAYHVKKWACEFAYMDAMTFDTPIFDGSVRNLLAKRVNDTALTARYERATVFRDYLNAIAKDFATKPYFDWQQFTSIGAPSFAQVENWLQDRGRHQVGG